MLKLKKIINSVTCFLVLFAFAGIMVFSLVPEPAQKVHTELISKAGFHSSMDLTVISEESDNVIDGSHASIVPSPLFFTENIFLFELQHVFHTGFPEHTKTIPDNTLYLTHRCLRL